MPVVAVSIIRFVDEHQPGFVECELTDAFGQTHSFVEKVPIVTVENLWSDSIYPRAGGISCEVKQEWQDDAGRSLVKVDTERPWRVESTAGATTFVVLSSQMLNANGLA
jgi:hypothetical protein